MSPFAVILAIGGAAFGLVADRIATRWPEHDDEHPAGRAAGWRTAVTSAFGAFALGLWAERFGGAEPIVQLAFAAWFVSLVVGFAVDLDQRLLPDEITLPVIPIAVVLDLTGRNPLVGPEVMAAIFVAFVVPLALYILSLPFGAGAFGVGDVKLLVGVGLMLGLTRTLTGLLAGLLASGIVLVVLLGTRRIERKTFVPFGPFLIFGALWGILVGS